MAVAKAFFQPMCSVPYRYRWIELRVSQRRNVDESWVRRKTVVLRLLPDFALGAVHQALDVGPMHEDQEQGEPRKQHGECGLSEPPQEQRRNHAGGQS